MLASPCSLFPTAPLPFTSILQLHWTWDTLFFHSCLWSGCVPCELLLSLPATSALMKGPSSVLPCITALVMLLSISIFLSATSAGWWALGLDFLSLHLYCLSSFSSINMKWMDEWTAGSFKWRSLECSYLCDWLKSNLPSH